MNRNTLVLLVIIAAVGFIVITAVALIVDAMVLTPPDVDTTIQVTGAIQ